MDSLSLSTLSHSTLSALSTLYSLSLCVSLSGAYTNLSLYLQHWRIELAESVVLLDRSDLGLVQLLQPIRHALEHLRHGLLGRTPRHRCERGARFFSRERQWRAKWKK